MIKKGGIIGIIFSIIATIVALFTPTSPLYILSGAGTGDSGLNITFDNGLTTDEYGLHTITNNNVELVDDRDVCLWYKCGNFSDTSGDYLETNMNFTLSDKMTVSFWIKPTVSPNAGSQAYYEMSTGDFTADLDYKYAEEGDYGLNTKWHGTNGTIQQQLGADYTTSTGVWTHYCTQYDGTNTWTYRNGVLIKNDSTPYGDLNYTPEERMRVGAAVYGIDLIGYMDEFLIMNTTNFNCLGEYDLKKAGTPPDLDLFVVNHTISDALNTLFDFSDHSRNITGNIEMTYYVKNQGVINTSGAFNTSVINASNGHVFCTDRTVGGLAPGATASFICDLSKSVDFYKLNIAVDSADEVDESSYTGGSDLNNVQRAYLDLRVHPRLIPAPNSTYYENSSNQPAYGVYNALVNFLSEDFNVGWGSSSIDPRAKKGYENALSCYFSDYNPADVACDRARNHLEGWLNGSISKEDYAAESVQALHEAHWVALTYDLMFNNLTQEEATVYSRELQDRLCFGIYGKSNVRPDLDDNDLFPGNGKGFGTGMAYPCLTILGEVGDNPSSQYTPADTYISVNTAYEWLNRADKHVASGQKGQDNAEGPLYGSYSSYHLLDLIYYDKSTGLLDIANNRQEEICKRGEYWIGAVLDHSYEGDVIRGDENSLIRTWSFGDSHSYDLIGEMDMVGAAMITQYAVLCDNSTTKSALKGLRDYLYDNADGQNMYTRPVQDVWYYQEISDVTPLTSDQLRHYYGFYVDPVWDRAQWATFNRDNADTRIVLDGGDKPAFGHPNAEFDIFSYVLGEPFLDYPQVPYEDDVRSERFHNTVSFSNSTTAGYLGTDTPCGVHLNQYYGGADIPPMSSYPDGNHMDFACRGGLSDSWGTTSGVIIGGAQISENYLVGASTPKQKNRVLIYDDTMLQQYVVNRSASGYVAFNWINIFEEFTPTISDNTLSFNRIGTSKHYNISPLHSDVSLSLEGGNSTIKASKQKTGSANLGVYYGSYRHHSTAPSANVVFLHEWYNNTRTGNTDNITSGNDVGVNRSGVIMLLDSGSDGIDYGSLQTDAWGMIIINTSHVGLSGASWIYNGTDNNTVTNDGIVAIASSGEPAAPEGCSYQPHLDNGLVMTCTPSGCTFPSLGCYFNASTTGRLEVRT